MFSVTAITAVLQIKRSKQIMELSAKESGLSLSLMSEIQKIRLTGAGRRAFEKWADIFSEFKLNGSTAILPRSSRLQNQSSLNSLKIFITVAIMLAGNLMFYYIADYIGAFNVMTSKSLKLALISPMILMMESILKTAPEISENKRLLSKLSGNIELNNVCFCYRENMPYVI